MQKDNEAQLIRLVAGKHGATVGAVETIFKALKANRARAATFSHPEFGGKSVWTPDRTEISKMSNARLRAKLGSIASELSSYLQRSPDGMT